MGAGLRDVFDRGGAGAHAVRFCVLRYRELGQFGHTFQKTTQPLYPHNRVTVVDEGGGVVMDTYVKPHQPIVDHRTAFSGVTAKHLEGCRVRLRDAQVWWVCGCVGVWVCVCGC